MPARTSSRGLALTDATAVVGAGEDFGGGAAAGADGAVHVAVPDVGGFGAGPVDAADGCGEGLAVLGPHAGAEAASVAAAGELFGHPVLLDDVERLGGLVAEVLHQGAGDQLAALLRGHVGGGAGVGAFEEADQHAAGGVGRGVVEHDVEL